MVSGQAPGHNKQYADINLNCPDSLALCSTMGYSVSTGTMVSAQAPGHNKQYTDISLVSALTPLHFVPPRLITHV